MKRGIKQCSSQNQFPMPASAAPQRNSVTRRRVASTVLEKERETTYSHSGSAFAGSAGQNSVTGAARAQHGDCAAGGAKQCQHLVQTHQQQLKQPVQREDYSACHDVLS